MLINAKIAALECEGDVFRLAVIKTGGKRPQIIETHQAVAEYSEDEDRFEARVAALEGMLDAVKATPAAFIFCARCHDAVIRNISIPFKGARRVAAAVQFELEPHLAFPIEELLFDFKISGEHDGETDVLVMGLRRESLEADLAVLAAAGVEPDSVTLDAAGLTALWQSMAKVGKGLHAVVHLREFGAVLAVTDGKQPVQYRGLNSSAEDFQTAPARVAREVQHTLRAFTAQWRGGGTIEVLHVTGGGIDATATAELSQALGLPIEAVDLMADPKAADGHADASAFAACAGAALSAAGGPFSLDFKRAERDWQGGARGVVAHLMFSSCLALLLLLCLAFFFHQGTLKNEAAAAQLQVDVDGVRKSVEELKTQGVGEGIDMAMFSAPTLLEILAEIATRMPDNKVHIEEISISGANRGSWLTLRGTAKSDEQFSEVFDALRQSSLFEVNDDPGRVLDGELTRFTIKAERATEESNE